MKSNIYYKKDKKCRPIKTFSYQNDYCQYITGYKYATPAEVWCYANQLSQNQTFEAKTYGDDETRIFVFNYREDIEVYSIIEYKDRYYTVTRVDTKDDYKTELFVYVQDTPKGKTPKKSEILPYSAD